MTKYLKNLLRKSLGDSEVDHIIASYDIIGDIAIIKIPKEVFDYREHIGNAILATNKSVKSVWAQVGAVHGEYRIRELIHIVGEKKSETIYHESGCAFKLDIQNVYFSPRLSHERQRIASLVNDGENIFNMFAGVGAFSIVIAKKIKSVKIYSSEININAYNYMLDNILLNKVKDEVIPFYGDAREIAKQLHGLMDRILMPLPEKAIGYYPDAISTLKGGGWIHLYFHLDTNGEDYLGKLKEYLTSFGGTINNTHIVREVGPRIKQVVFDIKF